MAEWITICGLSEAPGENEVCEVDAADRSFCVARIGGELRVLDNLCPHREGPLGQGWVEGQSVVCPWHAWAFDTRTGEAEPPERACVAVYPTRIQDDSVQIALP